MNELSTGIGSLSASDFSIHEALDLSFSCGIPYWPERVGLAQPTFFDLDPIPSEWALFLKRASTHPSPWIKFQIAGPVTRDRAGLSPHDLAPTIAKRAHDLAGAGKRPLIFLDEPSYFSQNAAIHRLPELLTEIRALIPQAKVGVHSCQDGDLGKLLALPLQFISFDLELSGQTLASSGPVVQTYLKQGGGFCLGWIPTQSENAYQGWDSAKGLEKIRCFFDSLVPMNGQQLIFSPACGLATLPRKIAIEIHRRLEPAK